MARASALIALTAVALLACTRSPKSAPSTSTAQTPAPAVGTTSQPAPGGAPPAPQIVPPRPPNPAGTQPSAPVVPSAAPASGQALPVRTDTSIQSLLTLNRERVVLAEDFSIGLLAGPKDLEGEERAAMTTAVSFLGSLSQGKIAKDLIASQSVSGLRDSLSYSIEKGDVPTSFRIGKPKEHEGAEIAFNVRLFRQEGSAEGEIYLASQKGSWLVSDFQISLAQLEEKRVKPEEKFFPNSYRWLLGE
jgi:hypothetical protein